MLSLSLTEIAQLLKGRLVGEDVVIKSVNTDTRALQTGDLYIAIKGDSFDGHDFAVSAQQQGAAAAILQHDADLDIPRIIVPDTRIALAELASAVRSKVGLPLIGITGSNGKTTVKEMTAAILSVAARVLYTQGNFNNDIGVPLTLLRLNRQYQYAVVEMGANHAGEIQYTGHYAQPDISILNNVGAAHIEGFGDLNGVAKAKSEIISALSDDGITILNADDTYFDFFKEIAGDRRVISFGFSEQADYSAKNIQCAVQGQKFVTQFELISGQVSETITLNLAGAHNVKNALAASAACSALGIELEQIKAGLQSMQSVKGRMQLLQGKHANLVINDSYNANPSSLRVALDVLQQCAGEHWVVLGAFGELGAQSGQLHADIGEQLKASGVDKLFAVGADAEYAVQSFGNQGCFFASQQELIKALDTPEIGAAIVLVKGSRAQHMEKVVAALVGQGEE